MKFTLTHSSLNFCDNNLFIFTLPDSIGYLCFSISPADTKPTHIVPMDGSTQWTAFCSCETMPTQKHHSLAELPNLDGFTRFASTASSQKIHSEGAAESEQ